MATYSNLIISSGQSQYANTGDIYYSTQIMSNGTQFLVGGVASDTTVSSGGKQYVSSGGVTYNHSRKQRRRPDY